MTISRKWRIVHLVAAALALGLQSRAQAEDTCAGDGLIMGDTDTQDAFAIAIDAGFLYVAGDDSAPGNGEWHVEKRGLADGSLVPGFGNAGVVTSDPSSNWDVARAIAVDASFLYIAGQDGRAGFDADEWRIEKRSLSDGALVPGFGTAGQVTVSSSGDYDKASAIVVDGGFMYVVGAVGFSWRIEKRNVSDGALAEGFGSGGLVTSGSGEAYAITVAGGALWVAGSDGFDSWRIEKRDPSSGALLRAVPETFPDVGCGYQGIFAIAADASGIYVVGEAAGQWRVERRNIVDGSLVFSQSLPSSGDCDAGQTITLDAGSMYVGGMADLRWRIEKRNLSDGAFVEGFGSGGVVTSGGFYSGAYAMAIEGGSLWVAGFDDIAGSDTQWRIERRSAADGALVPCSPTGTTTTTLPAPGTCVPVAVSDCKVRVKFVGTPEPRNPFNLRCLVTLGAASDGIDPRSEGVELLLAHGDSEPCPTVCFAQTVTPRRIGRCWRYTPTDFTSSGLRALRLCDVDPARGIYRLSARSMRSNLQCFPPYTVGLKIGDDCSPLCGRDVFEARPDR